MAKHYSGKRVAGRKPVGKRALSLLMALVMSLSLVQISAFAADGSGLTKEQEANKAAQVKNADNNGVTTPVDGKGKVTMEKTAAVTDEEGKFLMTLKVTTKDEIKQVTETEEPTIDVVLLIDNSWSMSDGGSSRLKDAKDAAKQFVNSFLGEKPNGKRQVAVYKFGDDAYQVSPLTSNKGDLQNKINGITDKIGNEKQGTNIQAGLRAANKLLNDKSQSSAQYRYVILLSDGAPTFYYEGQKWKTADKKDFIKVGRYQQYYLYTTFGQRLGDGTTSYIGKDSAYATVSEAHLLKNSGVEVYGIGIELQKSNAAKYTMYNSVTLDKDADGNLSYKSHYIDCEEGSGSSLATNLGKAFDAIVKNITVKTNAWKVTDKMSEAVSFDGFVEADENGNLSVVNGANVGAVLDAAGDSFVWDLKALATNVEIVGEGENTKYIYTLQYYVTLKDEYRNGNYYDANEKATLSFSFEDDLDKDGVQNLYYADFAVPQVKGYKADLSFTKVAHENGGKTPLEGVTFTLTKAPTADSQYINGYRTFAAQSMPKTESAEPGEVKFTGIPSGYTYILEETNAPDGYQKSGPWTVTVAYGKVTVIKDGKEVTLDKVENTLDPKPEDITITKVWQQSGTDYPEITLYVKNNKSETVATITASATKVSIAPDKFTVTRDTVNPWKFTVSGLPSVDVETGNTLSYEVEEAKLDGYNTSYSQDKLTVVNVSTGTTSFTVTKKWVTLDSVDTNNLSATMQLVANGQNVEGATVTLPENGSWTHTWTDLPEYDANGRITYSVVEIGCTPGYAPTGIENGTVTNTLQQAKTQFTVNKVWKDGDSVNGRPESIQVQLYRDGKATGDAVTLTATNSWTYTWNDLNKYAFKADGTPDHEYQYSAKEVNIPEDYASSVSGNTIINTRTGVTSVSAEKKWIDGFTTHGEVTLQLYRNGNSYGGEVTTKNGSYTWNGLDKYDGNGDAYRYTVAEIGCPDGYTTTVENDGNGNFTITNTMTTNTDKTSVHVTKSWLAPGDVTNPGVTFNLYRAEQGENAKKDLAGSLTLKSGETDLDFTNLDKYYPVQDEDGNVSYEEYIYTVEEEPIDGYELILGAQQYELNEEEEPVLTNKWVFVNRITGNRTLTATKVWEDAALGENVTRPDVQFQLKQNGENYGDPKTVGTDSKVTWTVPAYGEDGQRYNYTVEEVDVPNGYTATVGSFDENGSLTVTNTLDQAATTLPVQKIWVDGGDRSKRGAITLGLYQNGTLFATATIDENGTVSVTSSEKNFGGTEYSSADVTVSRESNVWNVTFINLPKYNPTRSAAYEYTVAETNAPKDYTPGDPVAVTDTNGNTTGYTITNTLTQMPRSVEIVKHWVDGGLTNRPALTFTLTATVNGQAVEKVGNTAFPMTITLTNTDVLEGNTNTWKKTVTNLPKYDDARNVITYQVEETTRLAGYDAPVLKAETADNIFEFTNTLSQVNNISVTATKKWANTDYAGYLTDSQKPVPVNITVGLYLKKGENYTPVENDGKLWVQTLTANEFQDTSCSFDGLNKYDSVTRELLEYRVLEVVSDGNGNWNPVGETVSYDGRTYEVGYETKGSDTTITNTFKAPAQYYYTVVGNYTTYLDGQKVANASETGVVLVGITGLTEAEVVCVDAMKYVDRNGATFQYIGGSIQAGEGETRDFADAQVTVEVKENNVLYTITLNYERRTSTPYTPSTSYTVTVNYLDKDSGAVIYQKYQTSGTAYTTYDVTAQDKIAITGYTYVETTGDALTGTLNGNKVINVYYTKDSDIDDGNTPTDPGTDIGDDDVPVTPAKPPKTGDSMGLWIAAAMVSGMGLIWLSLSGRKRKEEI